MITRATDAAFANVILNHPSVRPDVADVAEGDLDVSGIVGTPGNVCLVGEHGTFLVVKLFQGVYEVHTAITKAGRGPWAHEFAEQGARYMFTATDCAELLTRVPKGHLAAATLTHMMGFRFQFSTPPECLFRGKLVQCDIFSLSLQDWAARAPGAEERGAHFHAWLNKKLPGRPHAPDHDHNRVVGVALDMITACQVMKGVVWYNRWAFTARHPQISLVSADPVQVRFDAGVLTLRDSEITVEPCH